MLAVVENEDRAAGRLGGDDKLRGDEEREEKGVREDVQKRGRERRRRERERLTLLKGFTRARLTSPS